MPVLKVPKVGLFQALGAVGGGLAPFLPQIQTNIVEKRKKKEKSEADYRTLKALLDSPKIANSPMGKIILGLMTPRGDIDRMSPEEQGMLDPQSAAELYQQGDRELRKNASNILANLQKVWPLIAEATKPPKETTPFSPVNIPGIGVGVIDKRTGGISRIIRTPLTQSQQIARAIERIYGGGGTEVDFLVAGIMTNEEKVDEAKKRGISIEKLEQELRNLRLTGKKLEKEITAGPSPQDVLAKARTGKIIREEKLAPAKEAREAIRFGLERRKRVLELQTMRKNLRKIGKTKKDYKRVDSILKGIYNAARKKGAEGWEQVIAFLNKGKIPKTENVDSAMGWKRYELVKSTIATWEPWEREYMLTNMRALYGDSSTTGAVWTREAYNKRFAELKGQNPNLADEQIRNQLLTEKDIP